MTRMHHPAHPGEVLREFLSPDMGVTDAARHLGVSRGTLSRLLNGRSSMSADMAIRVGLLTRTSPESWLANQMQWDLWQSRRKPKPKVQPLPTVGVPENTNDYCQHLDATYALLLQIRSVVERGDMATVAEIARAVDWEAVTGEFETVAGRYRMAVYRHGRRIIRNLRRPYMLYEDCVNLRLQLDMLRDMILDSPSLLATAGPALQEAYKAVLSREAGRGHPPWDAPASTPWPTIEALIEAAEDKLRRGRELEAAGDPEYMGGRRVDLPGA